MISRVQARLMAHSRKLKGFITESMRYPQLIPVKSLKRQFSKLELDDEEEEKTKMRFGFLEDSYSSYLEQKEDIERQRPKLFLEIPHLSNPQLLKTVRRLTKYHMMDAHFFILLEKTLMNRLSDLEDNHLKDLLIELCLQSPAFKFNDFLFLEKRIDACLGEATKFNIAEWIPLLHIIAISNQQVSSNFGNMIWQYFSLHQNTISEEEKLALLSTVVLSNQGKPDQIPKELLSKLTRINTTAEFVASVPIVKHLVEQHNSHLIPEQYTEKVMQFIERSESNTLTLQSNIVELCDLLRLGNIGQELKKLVIYCQENFSSLSFSNLTRALDLVIKFTKKNPSVLNQVISNLMELQNDLATYILENGSSASFSELLKLGKIYCEIAQVLKVENPEHRKSILVLLKEGADLFTEEKDPNKLVAFLHLINDLLASSYRNYLLKGNEIVDCLTQILESGSTLKFNDMSYLNLLSNLYPSFTQVYKSRTLSSSELTKLLDPTISKALSVKMTSFERFVNCLTLLDQYADFIGSPQNRSTLLVKEQLLDLYKPPEKK